MIELSEEQSAAVNHAPARFSVIAAAGAGKTRVLVARFVNAVLLGRARADEILTITFTRKAAREMRARIVEQLRSAGRFEDAQLAETGPIQTVHGFLHRVLRENALDARMDPEVEIASGAESRTMRELALARVLTAPELLSPAANALISELAGERVYNSTDPHGKLGALVHEAVDALRISGRPLREFERIYADALSLQEAWTDVFLASFEPPARAIFEETTGSVSERLLAVKASSKNVAWMKSTTIETEERFYTTLCAFMEIAIETWRQYGAEMERAQRFDQTELEWRGVRLITDVPRVRQRLRDRYKLLLVDEAQDLNPIQMSLIQALQIEDEMLVGDAQQSIYGFRYADPQLFLDRVESLPSVRLARNHRTKEPGILRFIDDYFGKRWKSHYVPMSPTEDLEDPFGAPVAQEFTGVELWKADLGRDEAIVSGIQRTLGDGIPGNAIAVLCRTAKECSSIQGALERVGIASRVLTETEKFYTRMVVRDIANGLAALSDPNDGLALLSMLHSPFVDLSLDSVVQIASHENTREAMLTLDLEDADDAAKLQSFRRWLEPLSGYADRLPAWEVLSLLFAETEYLQRLARGVRARQDVANARRVLALAAASPHWGPREFGEHIRAVQLIGHRAGEPTWIDPAEDEVTLMTMHAAKGLEFPVVVVVADTMGRNKADKSRFDSRTGLAYVPLEPGARPFAKQWLDHLSMSAELAERDRLYYVAMTRAVERLILVASSTSEASTASRHLYQATRLAGGRAPGIVEFGGDNPDDR
ncbi:MAG: UvrD-helicase domain-containing protein [Chthonomonas sp.]|nr:UvrD-helicase domain-containing protein [Chthonomonas sp.]